DGPGFGSPICAGSSISINELFCGPEGMASYSWSVNCGSIDGPADERCVSWIPPSDGSLCTFSLVVVDSNGCTSTCTRDLSVPAPIPCGQLPPPNSLPFCGSTGNQYCVNASFTITNVTVSCADWSVVSWDSNCFIYNAGASSGPCEFLIDANNALGCPVSCVVSFGCQAAGEGCTPGYWKNHTPLWNQAGDNVSACVAAAISSLGAPYSGNGTTGARFRHTFGLTGAQMVAAGLDSNITLAQAINLGGGCFFKLARHAVAGLLSSCAVDYSFSTTDVLTGVHNAFVSLQCEPLATQLAAFNELNCPLNKTGASGALSEADEVLEPILPTEFALQQNYPNPFNPSTDISFSLPKAANVTLEIYNVLGQTIAMLVDEHKEAGVHTITWNAGNVSSGVYFYRLTTPEFVMSKKMLLMK
ncbi:MAG TPA: T9SS type A sorting domain-containing protein, partial [candidate division Zixibacteria bacterium]|nr:T9SS type A sorting domain-containing protein [candidate division Zixibacteria bacterium]